MNGLIEKSIEAIINCSEQKIFFLNERNSIIKRGDHYPAILVFTESSSIQDYDSSDNRPTRIIDVEMSIVEKVPRKDFVTCVNTNQRIPESDSDFAIRLTKRREEIVSIFEQIIYYLTSEDFPFMYDLVDVITYSNIFQDQNDYNLFGKSVTFSVRKPFKLKKCCVDFDENCIRNIDPKCL